MIAAIDRVLDKYMGVEFGADWRGRNDSSAHVAAALVRLTMPTAKITVHRVELYVMELGSAGPIILGTDTETDTPESTNPLYFAVQIGDALYDPAFSQVRKAKPAPDLPPEPYFYSEDFFGAARDYRWNGYLIRDQHLPKVLLRIGYKVLEAPAVGAGGMLPAVAKAHANQIMTDNPRLR